MQPIGKCISFAEVIPDASSFLVPFLIDTRIDFFMSHVSRVSVHVENRE